jgi:hypothetical protein
MNKYLGQVLAVASILVLSAIYSAPARAQGSEVKEKPPMYSYVGNWTIPRAQWGEMEKQTAASQKILEKALADGTVVGYGNDLNLIHQPDGETHDSWWSSMSQAGVLNVLDQIYKSGAATSSVFESATRHWDALYVSRYYNWHKGSWKDVYTRVAMYNLKPDAPPDAVDTLSKNLFVPLLEKLLADGAIHEYEVDTESIHTQSPAIVAIAVIVANAEGLDKFSAAVRETAKSNPMIGPALNSMIDFTPHRDFLFRTNATYK